MYVEISPKLAAGRGIAMGDWVKVSSARGEVSARALITPRVGPCLCGPGGSRYAIELIALPWHFGFAGYVTGGPDRKRNYAANQLAPMVGDANTMIPEYKVFLCDVRKA